VLRGGEGVACFNRTFIAISRSDFLGEQARFYPILSS